MQHIQIDQRIMNQNKRIKSLASIDMLKKYYKNKRNNYSHVKGAASIQLHERYNDSRAGSQSNIKSNNHSISSLKLTKSFIA